MKILNLELSKIKRDPNQPRKTFNPDKIAELAQTFQTVGIINPIEVDEDYMIITGENRYRAAQSLGWKTVPVKVLKMNPENRYIRQVIENIQYANLTPYETAIALSELLANSPGKLARDKFHQSDRYEIGIKELATKIGKSSAWITEHLNLLKAPKAIQEAIKKGLPFRNLRAFNSVPEEFRKEFQQKILANEFSSSNAAEQVSQAINRDPSKAHEILAQDYSKYKTSQEVAEAVSKIAPRLSQQIAEGIKPAEQLHQIVKLLVDWLDSNTPQSVGKIHLSRVMISLGLAEDEINKWKI